MKKLIYIIFFCISLVSCTLENSDNGNLDGLWQLTSVDTIATGTKADMHTSGVYWAISYNIFSTRKVKPTYSEIIYSFKYSKDSLIIYNPYISNRDVADSKVTDASQLAKYGVNNIEEKFKIIELDSDKMLLETTRHRLHFRKY